MRLEVAEDTEDATKAKGGVFVITDGDGVDTHLDNWIIVAAGLSHIAEVEDIFFCDIKLF